MKKLIMTLGLSLAVSSAVNADCGTGFPTGSQVVTALSNSTADTTITGLLSSVLSSNNPYAYVPSTLSLTPTLDTQNGNCHYTDTNGTNILTVSATNPNPGVSKTAGKKSK